MLGYVIASDGQCGRIQLLQNLLPLHAWCRHLAARLDVELRRTCALRVSELMGSPLPGSSPSYLHDTWTDLAMDHDEQVRFTHICVYARLCA